MKAKIRKAELETVAGVRSEFPQHTAEEFAFAGKSNVGKSSLINALMQRKSLARTSAVPGKTQTVNYYAVTAAFGDQPEKAFYLVDLPGYGYTKASPESRISWGKMVERYLASAKTLVRVFLLVDIRHEPSENDVQMAEWIRSRGWDPVVVATKLDKLKKNEIPGCLAAIRKKLVLGEKELLIPFSAESKAGLEELYHLLNTEGEV